MLCAEVLVGVLARLSLADLSRSAATCRTLHRVANDDRLVWRARCRDRYGPQAVENRPEGSTWEQHWDGLEQHFHDGCQLFNQRASEARLTLRSRVEVCRRWAVSVPVGVLLCASC